MGLAGAADEAAGALRRARVSFNPARRGGGGGGGARGGARAGAGLVDAGAQKIAAALCDAGGAAAAGDDDGGAGCGAGRGAAEEEEGAAAAAASQLAGVRPYRARATAAEMAARDAAYAKACNRGGRARRIAGRAPPPPPMGTPPAEAFERSRLRGPPGHRRRNL